MPANDGEEMLDALVFLGYTVDIADDGSIRATNGTETIHGKAWSGSIEWADRSAIYHVRERAYITRLRARVRAARPAEEQQAPVPRGARAGHEAHEVA